MSNDNTDSNESDDGATVTRAEFFEQLAEVAGDQEMISPETSESLQKVARGEATEEDGDQLNEAWDEWLRSRFGTDES